MEELKKKLLPLHKLDEVDVANPWGAMYWTGGTWHTKGTDKNDYSKPKWEDGTEIPEEFFTEYIARFGGHQYP